MNAPPHAKGITAQDLRIFLDSWPQFIADSEEVQLMLIEDKDKLLGDDASKFSWCHLYELPINQHLAILRSGLTHDEQIQDCYSQIDASPNQIAVLPEVLGQVNQYFAEMDAPSKEEAEDMRPFLAGFLGVHLSAFHSLRSVLFFGCFINELIERVRGGGHDGDKALFNAVRLDPTVVGCKPVIERISKAFLIKDSAFFKKLKAALNGKIGKREQSNFQKMRLIFEILYEAGASALTDDQLHYLFVAELKLYSGNETGGGNTKALRKFADTYMKKASTT
ncbi:MAG: hypothetical protein KJ958_15885 [Gammaproteobacteria bacterium]|nr:hypothetical protein [Gammaproteobacteria bacterium]MBU1980637.1 hypothetical protein [Gammaproteobacteria bacterium]